MLLYLMAKSYKPEEWINSSEAMKILGITRQAIAKAAKKNRNRAAAIGKINIGREPLYFKADVLAYNPRPYKKKEETK